MEITADLSLNIKEETLIDMHSVLNVMNVAQYELLQMQDFLDGSLEMEAVIDANVRAAEMLSDPQEAYSLVENIDGIIRDINAELKRLFTRHGLIESPEFNKHYKNLHSIFNILSIRAAEIQARRIDPNAWVRYDIDKLLHNFREVLRAIERNSHGGYRIVNNIAEHEAGFYFVNFEITSERGDHLFMPAVFQDIVRDLIANARKYTPPGGRILAGLAFSKTELRFVVSDTGSGIPPKEIPELVAFGKRGSNVHERPTRGGGFGLTKAYYVAKKFGGRMWINSTGIMGEGTKIDIIIPVPKDAIAGVDDPLSINSL